MNVVKRKVYAQALLALVSPRYMRRMERQLAQDLADYRSRQDEQ